MLTVIMCIELVVAFVVALGCFLFSVYFVIKRPRETPSNTGTKARLGRVSSGRKPPRTASRSQKKPREDKEEGEAQGGGRHPRSGLHDDRVVYAELPDHESSHDLEESLLSDEEDLAYGSFESADRDQPENSASWKTLKDALAAISPW